MISDSNWLISALKAKVSAGASAILFHTISFVKWWINVIGTSWLEPLEHLGCYNISNKKRETFEMFSWLVYFFYSRTNVSTLYRRIRKRTPFTFYVFKKRWNRFRNPKENSNMWEARVQLCCDFFLTKFTHESPAEVTTNLLIPLVREWTYVSEKIWFLKFLTGRRQDSNISTK